MATTAASTREKLLHARDAASRLAQFSTDQKNGILLAMSTAIEANVESILRTNEHDVKASSDHA
jgi:gamma-glutamyl phosphate reductase